MSSSQVYIVRDDAGGKDLTLGPQAWTPQEGNQTFGGIHVFPDFGDVPPGGFMKFSFDGISVAIWGTTAVFSQDFQVSIDDGTAYNTTTSDTSGLQNYLQWYQSPILTEGIHSMNISGIRATAVDLFLITPAPQTSLTGHTLLVDDSYEGINYIGSGWKNLTTQKFVRSPAVKAQPIMNGTHQSSTVGDALRFAFSGSRAQIYGILLQTSTPGPVSLSYTIDDGSPSNRSLTYQPPSQVGGTAAGAELDQLNVQLLDTGELRPGTHTIDLSILDANSQTLIVDYILYQPSFTSISAMPDLRSLLVPPKRTAAPKSVNGGSQRGQVIGAVVGGVFGALALIAIIVGLLFLRHRSRRRRDNLEHMFEQPTPFPPTPPPHDIAPVPAAHLSHRQAYDHKGQQALSMTIPEGYTDKQQTEFSPSATSAIYPTMTVRRDEIQRRLHELQMLVDRSEMQEVGGMSPSTIVSPGGSRVEDTEDLRRRIARLEEENARLAMLSEPPPY